MAPSSEIETLLAIMAALRAPSSGCAWDLAQTHSSLVPYALEEAYEVADAVERGNPADLRDELGDLLLQVVFHAQIASEGAVFSFPDVVRTITEKMVRRHPHIFAASNGAESAKSASAVTTDWERIKTAERAAKGSDRRVLDDVPLALPGLTRATKLQKKAAHVGFDWGDARLVLEKVREEIDEIAEAMNEDASRRDEAVAGEIGDLLFAVVNLARHAGVDSEAALRSTNAKFERRFAFIEDRLAERGSSPSDSNLEEMESLWAQAKTAGL